MPDSPPVAPEGVLVEGVPPWMLPSLLRWLGGRFLNKDYYGKLNVDTDLLLEMERRLRLTLAWGTRPVDAYEGLCEGIGN